MRPQARRTIVAGLCLLAAVGTVLLYVWWRLDTANYNYGGDEPKMVYIYPGTSWQQTIAEIRTQTEARWSNDLLTVAKLRGGEAPRPGAYTIEPNTTTKELYQKLRAGLQTPVQVRIRSVRLPEELYEQIGKQMMVGSDAIRTAMQDTTLLRSLGQEGTDFAYRVLPNTYEFYWTASAKEILSRLVRETRAFWSDTRQAQAKALGLSEWQVISLAAIVQEESAKSDEYPEIAGLYLNRLRKGMLLQADPTVKYALGEFGLRRILNKHLTVDSPYNTYRHKGLPPGPIRIPTRAAIEGVLSARDHDYLYMCAREDFSGYHAFAKSYSEHLRNARRYQSALNKRGIK